MIDPTHALPISRQAQLAGISRGSVYYVPKSVSAADLVLMRRLDELHLEHPFMGARMLRDELNRKGFDVGRKHVGTLMKRMGMAALYRKPGTSTKHPGHDVYPYLLSGLTINRANQVWALDTTYIPMAKGFVYLTAVMDWASRKVLASRVAITLEACRAVDVLHEAFTRHGHQRLCIPIKAASLPRRQSCMRSRIGAVTSAWTGAEPGGIMCSSSGCGNRSNMSGSISMPTTLSRKPGSRS